MYPLHHQESLTEASQLGHHLWSFVCWCYYIDHWNAGVLSLSDRVVTNQLVMVLKYISSTQEQKTHKIGENVLVF